MRGLHRDAPRWALTLFALCVGCARELDPCSTEPCDEGAVHAFGTSEGSISSNAVLSANGKYGAGCAGRAGQSWSVPFSAGAPLDYPVLEVARGNVACTLSLTSFRTGSGSSGLYTAASPIAMTASYSTGVLFSSPSDSLAASAKLSGLAFTSTFALTLLVAEGPTSVDAGARTHYAYELLVMNDAPLSYWRLDDALPATLVSDDFSGAKVALQSRTGWTKNTTSGTDAVVSAANRVRVGAAQKAVYLSQTAPTAADYAVSADVYVASVLSTDQAGVVARGSGALDSYYFAGFVQIGLIGLPLTRRFELWKYASGIGVLMASVDDTLVVGTTRRVTLEVFGNSIRASVDGTQRFAVTDTLYASAGSAGMMLGYLLGNIQSDSAGLHLDNFSVREANRARDGKAVNHGLYIQGVARSSSGALTVPNGSASFDGVDDYIEVTRTIANDFSIELWFKSTQGLGTAAVTQWQQTAGLVDASAAISSGDFGIGLRADGKLLAGTGKTSCLVPLVCGDDDLNLIAGGTYNDGSWHHVVFTRNKALGAMSLYVDGAVAATLATGGSTHTLDATTTITIGRIQTSKNQFAGQIDEVALYGSVLSAQAVLSHYQAGRF